MAELKEQLDGMGAPISDQSFAAMICKSLPTSYRSLLQMLSATAHVNNKILTSNQIIAAIHEEADELKVHKEADKAAENAPMVATQAKRRSEKKNVKCSNCKRNGHKMEDCFMKGGGKEGQAPWDKKKDNQRDQKHDGKKGEKRTGKANAASIDDTNNDNISLAVTYCPTEPLEALAVHPTNQSAIIDCGATRHFTPNRSDLINFISIEPKPIKAANGHILKATGKGDLKVILPMGKTVSQQRQCSETYITHLNLLSPLYLLERWTRKDSKSTLMMESVPSEPRNQIVAESESFPKPTIYTEFRLPKTDHQDPRKPSLLLERCLSMSYIEKWVI
jgi:hypothetical protein